MAIFRAGGGRLFRWLQILACAALMGSASAGLAAVFYVSNSLGEVNAADRATVAAPRPVQLLFTFQTAGAPNMRATNFIKAQVARDVLASGFFSDVGERPAANGAVLSITVNNIPERNAAGRGIGVGLTFGLRGTTVTDAYVVTFDYLSGPDAAPIQRVVEHAIRTTIGRTSPPENATRARSGNEAVATMIRQSLAHGLNALAKDPAFVPGGASPPEPPAPVPSP